MSGWGNTPTTGQDSSPGPEKRHPYLYYWLTAGAASIIAAAVGVNAATSSSPSSAVGQSNGSQNGIGSSNSVPAAYQGSWAGIISYPSTGNTEEITLALDAGQVGDEVGQWSSVTLNCSGTVTLKGGGNTLALYLVTTNNTSNVCASQVDAQVSQAGSNIAVVIESDFGVVPGSGTLTPTN
jgi:hypothetical protein